MKEDKFSALTGTEKLEKMCKEFPLLTEEKQDYILGILQALVFASNTPPSEQTEKRRSRSSASKSLPPQP